MTNSEEKDFSLPYTHSRRNKKYKAFDMDI